MIFTLINWHCPLLLNLFAKMTQTVRPENGPAIAYMPPLAGCETTHHAHGRL